MSNSDHTSNKHAAVLEEEIPVSVESQSSSQDPAKATARLDRLRNGLREHPLKVAIATLALLAILSAGCYHPTFNECAVVCGLVFRPGAPQAVS